MFAARFEFLIFKIDGRPPARQRGRVLEYVRNLPHVSFDAPLVDEVILVCSYDSDPLAGLIRINLASCSVGRSPKVLEETVAAGRSHRLRSDGKPDYLQDDPRMTPYWVDWAHRCDHPIVTLIPTPCSGSP